MQRTIGLLVAFSLAGWAGCTALAPLNERLDAGGTSGPALDARAGVDLRAADAPASIPDLAADAAAPGADRSLDAAPAPDGVLASDGAQGADLTGADASDILVCGDSSMSCGPPGGPCADCRGNANGENCVSQVCGCLGDADCQVGETCGVDGVCIAHCSGAGCSGGCCAAAQCVSGTDDAACGFGGGGCTNCAASGRICLAASGVCGCSLPSDCPTGQACNRANGLCDTACADGQHTDCNGGCCGTNGVCQPGNLPAACGATGTTCASCAGSAPACLAGHCGCQAAANCPLHQSCNPATGTCGTSCSDEAPCNSGCCSTGGTCVAGTSPLSCGSDGFTCDRCTGTDRCLDGFCSPLCAAAAAGTSPNAPICPQ